VPGAERRMVCDTPVTGHSAVSRLAPMLEVNLDNGLTFIVVDPGVQCCVSDSPR